jgi:hypothetical protein
VNSFHRSQLTCSSGWATAQARSHNIFQPAQYRKQTEGDHLQRIALREQDMIWHRKNKDPDILICLGQNKPMEDEMQSTPPSWLYDHRLQYNAAKNLSGSRDTSLASLFYLELIALPLRVKGNFVCHAQIKCRLPPSLPALKVLVEQLRAVEARFSYNKKFIRCINRQVYEEVMSNGEAFSRSFIFSILYMEQSIDVRIDRIIEGQHSISNCPYIVDTLARDQRLYCFFGREDHNRRLIRNSPYL